VSTMEEAELRARFDREVSSPNREALWKILKRERLVSDVCGGEISWEDFQEEALVGADLQRETLQRTKPPGRPPSRHYDEVEISLTDSEAEHAAALAPHLAKQAALSPEVRAFREEKLGGNALEPEWVVAFLQRELRHLPPQAYAELEPYLEEAHIDLVVGEDDKLKDLVGGWVNRSRASYEGFVSDAFREALRIDSMTVPIAPEDPYLDGLMHLVFDGAGSTLEDLGDLLVARNPWPLRDAAWFVLTGGPPEVVPLKVKYHMANGTRSLTFAPWVSEETIRRAYRSLQSGDNRPLTQKTLLVFRFVNERTELGQTPRWAELTERWNQQYPDDKFSDRSGLRRAYKRAEERLTYSQEEESERPTEVDITLTEDFDFPF